MCVLCMDYIWRTVLIAIAGIVTCAAISVVVFMNQEGMSDTIQQVWEDGGRMWT